MTIIIILMLTTYLQHLDIWETIVDDFKWIICYVYWTIISVSTLGNLNNLQNYELYRNTSLDPRLHQMDNW